MNYVDLKKLLLRLASAVTCLKRRSSVVVSYYLDAWSSCKKQAGQGAGGKRRKSDMLIDYLTLALKVY